jgi:hypothetical protein
MAARLVQLTSIILVMLVVLLGVTFVLGFKTNRFEPFWNTVQFTSSFLLIVGIWYLIGPPHRAIARKGHQK